MKDQVVILPGSDPSDLEVLRSVAAEFGWQVRAAVAPLDLDASRLVAVILQREAFGGVNWAEKVRRLRAALPGVRVITSHGFIEPIDWGELFDLGTFHAIRTPLSESEVRQSFGFLWQAEQRSASKVVPLQRRQTDRAGAPEPALSYAAS